MGKRNDPSGSGVPGHLRTGRSEPFGREQGAAGTFQTAQYSPGTKAGETGPLKLGVCWILNPFIETLFLFLDPQLSLNLPEPLFH